MHLHYVIDMRLPNSFKKSRPVLPEPGSGETIGRVLCIGKCEEKIGERVRKKNGRCMDEERKKRRREERKRRSSKKVRKKVRERMGD